MLENKSTDIPARKYFQYYHRDALRIIEDKIGIRPSLGDRMLIRRIMEEAVQGLEGMPIGGRNYYRLTEETLARYFSQFTIPNQELYDTICRGHQLKKESRDKLRKKIGEE